MSLAPRELLTPEEEELALKKARLAELEGQLADRELDLASFRADLLHFETRYLQAVGRHYALLDELKAQIAETIARRYPQEQDAHDRASRARSQARESARAAGEGNTQAASPDDAASRAKSHR